MVVGSVGDRTAVALLQSTDQLLYLQHFVRTPEMRNTASPSDGAPSPTISGCGAGNQPPSPSPADLAKKWGPGLAGSPMNLLQNQQR